MNLELFLYQYQNNFYYTLVLIYFIRIVINHIIYDEIESENVVFTGGELSQSLKNFKSFTPEEIKEEKKKYKYDLVKYDYYQNRLHRFFYYPFTFWWSINNKDERKVIKLKFVCNILNIICLIMTPLAFILFLQLQDINHIKNQN